MLLKCCVGEDSWEFLGILNITLLASEIGVIVQLFEHSLSLPFFGIGMKTDLFQSCGHCWVFQISLHIECSTFTASSFRIWKSSTGIPSPPLALFVIVCHILISWYYFLQHSISFYSQNCIGSFKPHSFFFKITKIVSFLDFHQ